MDVLAEARELYKNGKFSAALERLEHLRATRLDADCSLLKASLLEVIGKTQEARLLVDQALRSRFLTDSNRASGEFTLSRVAADEGDPDLELHHLQRSLSLAERANDGEQTCWAQLRILSLTAD